MGRLACGVLGAKAFVWFNLYDVELSSLVVAVGHFYDQRTLNGLLLTDWRCQESLLSDDERGHLVI